MSDTEPPSDPDGKGLDDTRTQIKALTRRVEAVEGWPRNILIAVVTGALGMCLTVAGAAWSLSAQLARTEAAIEAMTDRMERVEGRLDRMEERTWRTVPTNGREE